MVNGSSPGLAPAAQALARASRLTRSSAARGPSETPQEGPQGGKRLECAAQHLLGSASAQRVGIIIGWMADEDYQAALLETYQEWEKEFRYSNVVNRGQTSRTVTRLTPGIKCGQRCPYELDYLNCNAIVEPRWFDIRGVGT